MSTQVVARDRHAEFFCALALVAAGIERFATNVRHWQRTEVGEAEEAFTVGQKGSSAMPHKRNPILSENLCGLARIVRAACIPALENVALWHERDISHSSAERMIAPDATATLGVHARSRGEPGRQQYIDLFCAHHWFGSVLLPNSEHGSAISYLASISASPQPCSNLRL